MFNHAELIKVNNKKIIIPPKKLSETSIIYKNVYDSKKKKYSAKPGRIEKLIRE